jgi:pimeloyl-ACP methyl ester carboxylesterase
MSIPFEREPAPSGAAREILVDAGGTTLSGLLAEPDGPPRALIVALHGVGMHAGYYDATTAPGLSLLELGSQLGFAVWAPDRPGVGATADLPFEQTNPVLQAVCLLDAIDAFAAEHPVGGGVLLVAHSLGLRIAWAMAASPRGSGLLGIDGVGNGVKYAFSAEEMASLPDRSEAPPKVEGDRGFMWGPTVLYPPTSFTRGALPLVTMKPPPSGEWSTNMEWWSEDLSTVGHRIHVPVRLTFGEHERFWNLDPEHTDELRAVLPNVPSLSVEIERHAGHNVSLAWAARSYHLKVVAFAEACLLARALG